MRNFWIELLAKKPESRVASEKKPETSRLKRFFSWRVTSLFLDSSPQGDRDSFSVLKSPLKVVFFGLIKNVQMQGARRRRGTAQMGIFQQPVNTFYLG